MDRERITAWITKYALTKGIQEVEGKTDGDGYLSYGKYDYNHAFRKEWYRTREAAIKRAEEMRLKKIASLKKQLKKLEKMRFE